MKIQFKKIKMQNLMAEPNSNSLVGAIYEEAMSQSEVDLLGQPVELDYDNLSTDNKKIVDDFINLIKNS